jgi:hypothetical protein
MYPETFNRRAPQTEGCVTHQSACAAQPHKRISRRGLPRSNRHREKSQREITADRCRKWPDPLFRHKAEYDFAKESGMVYVEKQAHGSADVRGSEATGERGEKWKKWRERWACPSTRSTPGRRSTVAWM